MYILGTKSLNIAAFCARARAPSVNKALINGPCQGDVRDVGKIKTKGSFIVYGVGKRGAREGAAGG